MGITWTVTFGEALTVLSILCAAFGMFFGVRFDVQVVKHDLVALNQKVDLLAKSFEQLATILTKVAVQDNRLDRVEKDLRELRHGEGMVLPLFKSAREVP